MKIAIEAGRTFLYETSRIVDIKECIEETLEDHPEREAELAEELKRFTQYAALFTPALKAYTTEMGNSVCYDALQIHGGSGFTKDYDVERHTRDVRITNIYEGTTQLQVVATIGGIISGIIFTRLDDYETQHDFTAIKDIFKTAQKLRDNLKIVVDHLHRHENKSYQEYHARRVVEMGNDVIISYLLCIDALKSERKQKVATLFINKAVPRCQAAKDYILSDDDSLLKLHADVIS